MINKTNISNVFHSVFFKLIILYCLLLSAFLWFGDRLGWEGDDVDQIEGILNFSWKGKAMVYRYSWQPLAYELNLGFYRFFQQPKLLFIFPQIIGSLNICLLVLGIYLFAQRQLNLILCFSFLIFFPELFFCGLYYNSTVFTMLPMAICLIFLFWQKSPFKAIHGWQNIRYFMIGLMSTFSLFFRLDFLLALPLLWYFMIFDESLKEKGENYGIYTIVSLTLLLIFTLTDIFNVPKILEIFQSHETIVEQWTWQESFNNLFSITNVLVWLILIIYAVYFVGLNLIKRRWRNFAIILIILPIFFPLPTLTSPKYLIPGIILLPFLFAKIILDLKKYLTSFQFKSLCFVIITLAFLLQILSFEIMPSFPYFQITQSPKLITTHDGYRVSGAYIQGYNEVRKAQNKSFHPPIQFSRTLANIIATIPGNVTVLALKKENNMTNEAWVWQFTTLYLQLKNYQVKNYDRDATITLISPPKTVKFIKLEQSDYERYQSLLPSERVIKLPYVTSNDSQGYQKAYNCLAKDLKPFKLPPSIFISPFSP